MHQVMHRWLRKDASQKSVPEAWSEKIVYFKEDKEIISIWEEGEWN